MQVSEHYIVFVVIIITCSLLVAAAALLAYVRMYNDRKKKHFEEKQIMASEFDRQLMQSRLETQEDTMSMLSKELHDNVGQLLNSTKLLIGVAQRGLENPPDTLITASETLGLAIQELRSLSKSLDKEWLSQFNFIENLEAEVNRVNSSRTLHIYFSRPETLPLPPNEQIILFRIVQELVQNAIKHAHAEKLYIRITRHTNKLLLTITDDGSGFDISANGDGMGMRNIRHRIQLLGGTVQWQSAGEKGTVVIIELPINPSFV